MVTIRNLSKNDLDDIANLHTEVFPNYFLTHLGKNVLRLFYSQFVGQQNNIGMVAVSSGNIVGFVTGTTQAPTLYRKFYRCYFIKVASAVLIRLITDPVVRGGFFSRISHVFQALVALIAGAGAGAGAGAYLHDIGGNEGITSTEITARLLSIGVASSSRGNGIAESLVDFLCDVMANNGEKAIGLSVLSNNKHAISFYEKSGWVREFETHDAIYYMRPAYSKESPLFSDEIKEMAERYSRRKNIIEFDLYNRLNPDVYMSQQEKERAIIYWIKKICLLPLKDKRLLEVGCGSGGNLVDFIRLGFRPENLIGNELLEARVTEATKMLPSKTPVIIGDAATLDFGNEKFDVVFQSTVFTSILDDNFQTKLAKKMWDLVKPGGYVLWYDFVYNNPRNSDVKGVTLHRVRQLFPNGEFGYKRLTLAPPLSRFAFRIHPNLYYLFNLLPFLRTHVLCWIKKPGN